MGFLTRIHTGLNKAITHKTAAVWPLASYQTNYSTKINKTCWAMQEKQEQTHKQCSQWTLEHRSVNVG